MERASSAARSPYAPREIQSRPSDAEVDTVINNLSAFAQAKDQGVSGDALRRQRQPLVDAKFTDRHIADWSIRVQRTGGNSREELRRDIRNALNTIAAGNRVQ